MLQKQCWVVVLVLILGVASNAHSEDFYRGKTVRIIVGFSAGGGFDAYARLLARHIGKYIPGNPTMVVLNMPGAGSFISANYVYNPGGQILNSGSNGFPVKAISK